MTCHELIIGLRKFYWISLSPALMFLGLLFLVVETPFDPGRASRLVTVIFLIAGGMLAIAVPVWQRILFSRNITQNNSVDIVSFVRFQKRLMVSGLLTAYLVPLGFVCNISQVPFFWIIILALYGTYYYYPSQKRIRMDCRIFRIPEFK
jgi:hypothetical protein